MNLLEAVVAEMTFLGMPAVRTRETLDRCGAGEVERLGLRRALRGLLIAGVPRQRVRKLGMSKPSLVYPVDLPALIARMAEAGLDSRAAEAFMWWKAPVKLQSQARLAERSMSLRYGTANALVKMLEAGLALEKSPGEFWVTTSEVMDQMYSPWKTLNAVGRALREFTNSHIFTRPGPKLRHRIDLAILEEWYNANFGVEWGGK